MTIQNFGEENFRRAWPRFTDRYGERFRSILKTRVCARHGR